MSCLTATGTVVRVDARGRFEVELPPPPQCSGCSGFCAWGRRPAVGRLAALASPQPLEVGDAVEVRLPERVLLTASMLLYGLPLAALISGAAAGAAVAGTDLGAAVGAVAASAAAWLLTPGLR
ncbi:MAG TPA: SoxR reducing system RseC family protein, partial [Gammaproteobacteria bacterium]|nr:SoxR reducing system RseC family protein [Gammaproteobacteria bacterium]